MEASIGPIKFTLTWEGDIAADLEGGEQQRALKIIRDFKRLAGNSNGSEPVKRPSRLKKRATAPSEEVVA